jgi:DNA-directed RNA polymerase sigma subunit (sigma70/sigma32)
MNNGEGNRAVLIAHGIKRFDNDRGYSHIHAWRFGNVSQMIRDEHTLIKLAVHIWERIR